MKYNIDISEASVQCKEMEVGSCEDVIRNLHQTLDLSRQGCFNDVTIICGDGKFHSNSFLLATIFPVVRNIFHRIQNYDENIIISLPDVNLSEFEHFFQAFYQRKDSLEISKGITDLMQNNDSLMEAAVQDFKSEVFPFLEEESEIKESVYAKSSSPTKVRKEKNFKCNQCDFKATREYYIQRHMKINHGPTDFTPDDDAAVDMEGNSLKTEAEDSEEDDEQKDIDSLIVMIDPLDYDEDSKEDTEIIRIRKGVKSKNGKKGKQSNEKMAQCPFCDYKARKYNVKTHISRVHNITQCPHCDFHTNTKSSYRNHLKTFHPSALLFKCEHCDFSTKTKWPLTRHIFLKHPEHVDKYHEMIEDGKQLCKKCMKFLPNSEYEEHMLEHNQEMEICNICGKLLKGKSNLKYHIQTVHQILEKKYFCEKCNAGFAFENGLNQHMRRVHSEKYPCPLCGENFFEHRLKRHIADMHTPDDQKKYQCKDCGKGFNDTKRLEIHRMNVHLKLQPYKCRYGCDIAYNDISNRNQHEKKKHGKLFTTAKEEKIKEILGSQIEQN